VREIHLSARQTIRSGMIHRNEQCSMGAYSQNHEYEWREASVEKIRRARNVLTNAMTVRDRQRQSA
jgi:hypothetical protein